MSDAGTGGGGGCSVVANDLKEFEIRYFKKDKIRINFTLDYI
jgi:hypothetical protein